MSTCVVGDMVVAHLDGVVGEEVVVLLLIRENGE